MGTLGLRKSHETNVAANGDSSALVSSFVSPDLDAAAPGERDAGQPWTFTLISQSMAGYIWGVEHIVFKYYPPATKTCVFG